MTPVLSRRLPAMVNFARGMHWPAPYEAPDGWRCHDCGQKLRPYRKEDGVVRLRHRGYAVKDVA